MSPNTPFFLFQNCIITKGASRYAIYDLQMKDIICVPLSLGRLIESFQGFTLDSLRSMHKINDHKSIEDFFKMLLIMKKIYLSNDIHLFPRLAEEFDSFSLISNAIIEISELTISIFSKIVNELTEMNCVACELRYFRTLGLVEIKNTIDFFIGSTVTDIQIAFKYNHNISFSDLFLFLSDHNLLTHVLIYDVPQDLINLNKALYTQIILLEDKWLNTHQCGVIAQNQFVVNVAFFSESLHHNTCLNRKIAIDAEGNIKNCPSMKESFGNIQDTTLEEAINKPGFKKYWNIKKDEITKCKDCEFRRNGQKS